MKQAVEEVVATLGVGQQEVTRKQIRGSSLLLSGRLLAIGINFTGQVLIVRYLSTTAYGAWAYALSVVALLQSVAMLGLHRSTPRFVPIYHEKQEYGKLFGTVALVLGSIVLMGLMIAFAFYGFPEQISRLVNGKEQPLELLFILLFLAPLEAFDTVLIALFASFGSPRAIFARKYLLGPGLKFAVVLLLILYRSSVKFLAYGYLAASVLGVLIYSSVLLNLWKREGLLAKFRLAELRVPVREIFSYTIPLLTTDLLMTAMYATNALLLGYFRTLEEVGLFRVVLPIAMMMSTVFMTTFSLLYTPSASRLFAKGDGRGMNELYWRTAAWLATLAFSVFAIAFTASRPLAVLFFGSRYEAAGAVLSLLIVGTYFDAALGFNNLTLQVVGKVRFVMTANLLAAVFNIALNLVLIPRFGAVGAAAGIAATLILYNLTVQAGLRLTSDVRVFDRRYRTFYFAVGLSMSVLVIARLWDLSSVVANVGLAVLAWLWVFLLGRRLLQVKEMFPELARVPLMRLIFT